MPRHFARHIERHLVDRTAWLRAAVLGANDGIVSTASLIVGVAASGADRQAVLVAGVAGLVAGAMSMAAGEYVSVSSQADSEAAERARETAELKASPAAELDELTAIYVARGVEPATARTVAEQLSHGDVLAVHLRDELGHSDTSAARPVQAAFASAGSFLVGAAAPLLVVLLVPVAMLTVSVSVASLVFLAVLGIVGARAGGAPVLRATLRVTFWGVLAMAATAGIGRLFGAVV